VRLGGWGKDDDGRVARRNLSSTKAARLTSETEPNHLEEPNGRAGEGKRRMS